MKINWTSGNQLEVKGIKDIRDIPFDLLQLADPSIERINAYVFQSEVYSILLKHEVVAVLVLMKIDVQTMEVMNLAVDPLWQNKGLGAHLLECAKEIALQKGYKKLWIATGNSSLGQLHLYKKVGFKEVDRIQDYFIQHYPEPIFENGIQCRDKVILEMKV